MKAVALACFMAGLASACAHDSSDGASSSAKTFWSSWTSSDGSQVMNLQGGQFGVVSQVTVEQVSSGALCTCSMIANGSDATGTYTSTGCIYSGGGSGDPGCASQNQTGGYFSITPYLRVCSNSGSCILYH